MLWQRVLLFSLLVQSYLSIYIFLRIKKEQGLKTLSEAQVVLASYFQQADAVVALGKSVLWRFDKLFPGQAKPVVAIPHGFGKAKDVPDKDGRFEEGAVNFIGGITLWGEMRRI